MPKTLTGDEEFLLRRLIELQDDVNIFFLIVMGILVFLMQAGFAFLEAGAVRSKNTTTILLKNMIDACVAGLMYWSVGFAFAFGGDSLGHSGPFIGYRQFFLSETPASEYAFFFFQYVFAATAATIVSGAIAERASMISYFSHSIFITGFIYPLVTHWVWSDNGWLSKYLYYYDFAGSSVVHIVGGTAAFWGAFILGPRLGRFTEGKSHPIPGHSTVLLSLGYFILFFGFFAFNGGSELGVTGEFSAARVARAVVNTMLSGCIAGLTTLVLRKAKFGKADIRLLGGTFNTFTPFAGHWSLTLAINGSLTGLVAICAGAAVVEPWGAVCIGMVAAVVFFISNRIIEFMRIDDPLSAVSVHFAGGWWGIISVTLFANHPLPLATGGGVLYRWNGYAFAQLGLNIAGALIITLWVTATTVLLFGSLRLLGWFRIPEEAEEDGMDFVAGEPAYPLDIATFAE